MIRVCLLFILACVTFAEAKVIPILGNRPLECAVTLSSAVPKEGAHHFSVVSILGRDIIVTQLDRSLQIVEIDGSAARADALPTEWVFGEHHLVDPPHEDRAQKIGVSAKGKYLLLGQDEPKSALLSWSIDAKQSLQASAEALTLEGGASIADVSENGDLLLAISSNRLSVSLRPTAKPETVIRWWYFDSEVSSARFAWDDDGMITAMTRSATGVLEFFSALRTGSPPRLLGILTPVESSRLIPEISELLVSADRAKLFAGPFQIQLGLPEGNNAISPLLTPENLSPPSVEDMTTDAEKSALRKSRHQLSQLNTELVEVREKWVRKQKGIFQKVIRRFSRFARMQDEFMQNSAAPQLNPVPEILARSPDQRRAVVFWYRLQAISLVDLETGQTIGAFLPQTYAELSATFSSDGKTVYFGVPQTRRSLLEPTATRRFAAIRRWILP